MSWRSPFPALVAGVSLCAFAVGCGPDQAEQVPSAPVGSIAGKVTSLKDGTPLGNVKVSVLQINEEGTAAETTVNTGADGAFAIGGLPAGTTYRVRYELSGFVSRFHDVEIPASAGNYPQGNGIGEANIALAPATGGISGKVIAGGARAASGVKIGIDLRPADFDFVAQVTTDSSGNYTFTGLPGSPTGVPVTLVVQPYDEDSNGTADYDVLQINSLSFPDVTTRTEIDLRAAASELTLLASDLDDGEHSVADNMNLTFNRPVNPDRLDVSLTDLDTNRPVGASGVASGNNVVVSVSGGKLAEGTHYLLEVDARAANGSSGTFSRYFRAVAASNGTLPSVTGLKVTPEMADWDSNSFNLQWNIVPGAQAYRVYARDNQKNPAYVLLKTVGSSPNPQTSLTLPSEFDTFSGDAVQTPFAFKTAVDFAVVAVNNSGDAAAPGANPVHVQDTIAGTIISVTQSDGVDNTSGSAPKIVDLHVTFDEYVDVDNPPTVQLPGGLLSTFEADASLMSGKFELVIPPGANPTGTFVISGAQDTSGNPFPQYDGTLLAVSELLTNGSFETCDLTGWTPYLSSYSDSPIATSAIAASGSCSVQVGNRTSYSESGSSGVYQTFTVPLSATSLQFSVKYQLYTNYAYCHDYLYCELQTAGGGYVAQLLSACSPSSSWQTTSYTLSTAYAGQSLRVLCYMYQDGSHASGAYLDDISITALQ